MPAAFSTVACIGCRNGIVNQNRDIAGGCRELGQRIQLLRVDGSQKCVHLQLGSEYLAGQAVACGNGRWMVPNTPISFAVDQHLGTAARVIGRLAFGSKGRALDVQLTQQCLDRALELEEGQAAVAAEGQDLLLVRQYVRVSLCRP